MDWRNRYEITGTLQCIVFSLAAAVAYIMLCVSLRYSVEGYHAAWLVSKAHI